MCPLWYRLRWLTWLNRSGLCCHKRSPRGHQMGPQPPELELDQTGNLQTSFSSVPVRGTQQHCLLVFRSPGKMQINFISNKNVPSSSLLRFGWYCHHCPSFWLLSAFSPSWTGVQGCTFFSKISNGTSINLFDSAVCFDNHLWILASSWMIKLLVL